MILTVFGTNLAAGTKAASALPLPVQMQGASATINGVPAPLYYVSPAQVNLQIPFEIAPGTATLTITVNGRSTSQQFVVRAVAPGIFTDSTNHIVPSTPASRGHSVTLFFTGQGTVSPAVSTGAAPPDSWPIAKLPKPVVPLSVTVGGVPAQIEFEGIPYGLVGVTQVNFKVPGQAASGDQPVVVELGDTASPSAYLTVNP